MPVVCGVGAARRSEMPFLWERYSGNAVAHLARAIVMEPTNEDRRVRRTRRAKWTAVAYTVIVAGAVGATAIPGVMGRRPLVYDPGALLEGFEVMGLIWAAYFAYQAFHTERRTLRFQQQSSRSEQDRLRQETRRRARSIAQAVHVELDSIFRAALAVGRTGLPGVRFEGLPHPLLTRALESAELFQPKTVWCMAEVLHAISGLRSAVEGYRAGSNVVLFDDPNRLKPPRPAFTAKIEDARAAADATIEAIKGLRIELNNEACETPEPREAPAYLGLIDVSPGSTDLEL